MKKETLAIHGASIEKSSTGDVSPSLHLSTTFFRDENGGYPGGHMYTRVSNPNRKQLEHTLCSLEGGEDCAAFSSGNAAGMTIFQALEPNSHIIAPDDMYWGLKKQLLTIFNNILEFSFVDLNNKEELKNYLQPNTKMIWAESPSNPLIKVYDLEWLGNFSKANKLIFVCDSTFASPCLQNPIKYGVDIVLHSSTKYIGGHSDVLGGALITAKKDEFWSKIKNIQEIGGAVPSPFDCFLLLRSIKTLHYRMLGHAQNAQLLAEYLENHPKIESVLYPGLKSHPNYEVASRMMKSGGGMLSVTIKDGEKAASFIANNLKLFAQATSLGGVESLIEHRYSVEGPNSLTPKNLLRVSVGLENIEDLIQDFSDALDKI